MSKLEQIIKEKILAEGKMPIDEFMRLAMYHPEYGYYTKKQPLGKNADFITSPEISQLFGEIIAVYMLNNLPNSDEIALIELGAGKGTLMADILRAFAKYPKIKFKPYILEINKELIKIQKQALSNYNVKFISDIDNLPALPSIIYANEFFDCLPIKQFSGNEEVFIYLTKDVIPRLDRGIQKDSNWISCSGDRITESSADTESTYSEICKHLKQHTGLGLFVDYGYFSSAADTLQAIQNHQKVDIFHDIGNSDLSAHVNFAKLIEISEQQGLNIKFAGTQEQFLINNGIQIRAEALRPHKPDIDTDIARLVVDMGQLFKVLSITS